jgi:hypothetical protein
MIIVIKIGLKETERELDSIGSGQDPIVGCYDDGIGHEDLTAGSLNSSSVF